MKTLKINLVSLLALSFAFVAMSFNVLPTSSPSQMNWYEVGPADANNKHPIGNLIGPTLPIGDCQTATTLEFECAVQYDGDPTVLYIEDISGPYSLATSDDEPN